MTNYNDGQWHDWGRPGSKNRAGCPEKIHPKSLLDVLWVDSCGTPLYEQDVRAECVIFSFVVTFRVVKEYREPREWWLTISRWEGSTTIHNNQCSAADYNEYKHKGEGEIIHVREVIDNG